MTEAPILGMYSGGCFLVIEVLTGPQSLACSFYCDLLWSSHVVGHRRGPSSEGGLCGNTAGRGNNRFSNLASSSVGLGMNEQKRMWSKKKRRIFCS